MKAPKGKCRRKRQSKSHLTIGTALILIGKVGAPTGIDGAEAQLGDAVAQEQDEGSSWHDFRGKMQQHPSPHRCTSTRHAARHSTWLG